METRLISRAIFKQSHRSRQADGSYDLCITQRIGSASISSFLSNMLSACVYFCGSTATTLANANVQYLGTYRGEMAHLRCF